MQNIIHLTAFIFFIISTTVVADCSTDQSICNARCALKYFSDEAAELGCKTRCSAKRAVCSTKIGAKSVTETSEELIDTGVEKSKNAWDNTKSFFNGLTDKEEDDESENTSED